MTLTISKTKVTRKKIEFFQNTSKLVSQDVSGASESRCFCFNIFDLLDIWQKNLFFWYQFFASNLFNYQRIFLISEFMNSGFQDGSFGTHIKEFWRNCFFACISEVFKLKYQKNWFPVGNFNLPKNRFKILNQSYAHGGVQWPKSNTVILGRVVNTGGVLVLQGMRVVLDVTHFFCFHCKIVCPQEKRVFNIFKQFLGIFSMFLSFLSEFW